METALWIVTGLAFLCWLGSWLLFLRFRSVPSVPADRGTDDLKLSIVIPARNEEANIKRLLDSLASQPVRAHEIIVVDDQSGDRTAERARAAGARVVAGNSLPEGWLGKPWACQQGADAATGDWLLFLDADTTFEPGGLAALVALAGEERHVHSVCPYHRVEAAYEQLSLFFNVIMLLGMNAFSWKGSRAREIGLFGQALLMSGSCYRAIGGHRSVKGEVLENFHLSRHLAREGATCHCWLGKGVLEMRMFPDGLPALVAGWSKGAVSGAGNTPRAALLGVSVWLSGLIMMTILLLLLPFASGALAGAVAGLYGLGVAQVAFLGRRAGSFRFLSALAFPVGLIFYQVVFFRALWRKKRGGTVEWKGRHVA